MKRELKSHIEFCKKNNTPILNEIKEIEIGSCFISYQSKYATMCMRIDNKIYRNNENNSVGFNGIGDDELLALELGGSIGQIRVCKKNEMVCLVNITKPIEYTLNEEDY